MKIIIFLRKLYHIGDWLSCFHQQNPHKFACDPPSLMTISFLLQPSLWSIWSGMIRVLKMSLYTFKPVTSLYVDGTASLESWVSINQRFTYHFMNILHVLFKIWLKYWILHNSLNKIRRFQIKSHSKIKIEFVSIPPKTSHLVSNSMNKNYFTWL